MNKKCIDYTMFFFLYNLYIFVLIQHSYLANMGFVLDPSNNVIKRLWCNHYMPSAEENMKVRMLKIQKFYLVTKIKSFLKQTRLCSQWHPIVKSPCSVLMLLIA